MAHGARTYYSSGHDRDGETLVASLSTLSATGRYQTDILGRYKRQILTNLCDEVTAVREMNEEVKDCMTFCGLEFTCPFPGFSALGTDFLSTSLDDEPSHACSSPSE
jgi:hypothetical protein